MNKIHRNEMWGMGPCCLHVMKCELECHQTLTSLRNVRKGLFLGGGRGKGILMSLRSSVLTVQQSLSLSLASHIRS